MRIHVPPRCTAPLALACAMGPLFLSLSAASAQMAPVLDQRRIHISLGAQGQYDSNSVRRTGDAPSAFGPHRDDFILEPRATADIVLPFGRQAAFLQGSAGYRFHAYHDFLDRETLNATAGLRLRPIRPCTANLATILVRQQSDLANIFDTLDPKNTETIATGAADLRCAAAAGLSTQLGYQRTRATNSAPVRASNEYESQNVTGAIGVSRQTLGALSVYGAYGTTRYPNRRPLNGPQSGREDGAKITSAGLRYERQIGTRLTGELSGGYMKVQPRLPGVPAFQGASWSADLSYDSRNRFVARLGASRTAQPSNLVGESYGIATSYQASLEYAVTPRLRLRTGLSYARRRFEQSPLYQLPSFNSRDRTISVYARLTAGNVGPVAIVFDAVREHRNAAVLVYNYGSTRLGVTATYRFGR